MYIQKIRKHGDESVFKIPQTIVNELGFNQGKFVEVRVYNGTLVVQLVDDVLAERRKDADKRIHESIIF